MDSAYANGKPIWTTDQIVSQLLDLDMKLPGPVITYSFTMPDSAGVAGDEAAGYTPFNAAQMTATRLALAQWAAVTPLSFQEISGAGAGGTIRFANTYTGPAYGWTIYNGDHRDVWIDPRTSAQNLVPGQWGFYAVLHEIGHALGLDHPGKYNGKASYDHDALFYQDSRQYTVMSGFDASNTGNWTGTIQGRTDFGLFPATPLLYDIAAIQKLYGANLSARLDDTTYPAYFLAGLQVLDVVSTIWDAGGQDTIDLSAATRNLEIDLRQGAFSGAQDLGKVLSIAYGAEIENAKGGRGDDIIIGNALNNVLIGGLGSDTINGGDGIDTAGYAWMSTDLAVTRAGSGYAITGKNGSVDTLNNIEFISFADIGPIPINEAVERRIVTFSENPLGTSNPAASFADNTVSFSGTTAYDPNGSSSYGLFSNAPDGSLVITLGAPVDRVRLRLDVIPRQYAYTATTYSVTGLRLQAIGSNGLAGTPVELSSALGIAKVVITPAERTQVAIASAEFGKPVAQPKHTFSTTTFSLPFYAIERRNTGTVMVDLLGAENPISADTVYLFPDGGVDERTGSYLVDDLFYDIQNQDLWSSRIDPETHYRAAGWKEGRDPNAFFSTSGYLERNADVRAAGIDPLAHYEAFGWREGRNPSDYFDTNDYLAANPDVKAAGINPLLHFLQSGQSEGRVAFHVPDHAPDRLVDAAYYYAANPDVKAAGLDASTHYIAAGAAEGRNPNPFFDTAYYLAQNPDVRAAGIDPLLHFENYGWREGRQPSLLFDDAKYLAANPDVQAAGINPLLHYITSGQQEGRHAFLTGGSAPADPLIDPAYYDRQLGATLTGESLAIAAQAAWSFENGGWQKGLNPNPFFDTAYYLAHNADVLAAHIDPLIHYETFGWKEGRDPSAQFSTNKYLTTYADVRQAGVDPLLHYITNGQAEGRSTFAA